MKFFYTTLFLALASWAKSQTEPYFQQEVNYTIDVALDDKNHILRGFETFTYVNNSPDTLADLVLHLWPNAYKNSKTAMAKQKFQGGDYFMLWAPESSRGYIDSIEFKVDNQIAKWEFYKNFEDIAILYLDRPLAPGKSITVSTPFKVKIPSGSISRLGHIGESYQITQWYVKPAVYDRNGWHEMPYLTQGEFYSEYGTFDVKITLPSNYIVGATGDLQNKEEIAWMDQLSQQPLPRKMENAMDDFPASAPNTKTLQFIQKDVHDFGWFADKRWIVRKGSMELPHSKRTVTTYALFTPKNADEWETNGLKAIRDGLYYYSLWTGDYPYNQCTAVDGTISAGGGMEYPNVTVIGNTSSAEELATVIIHEVGHNWFYGILGSNERDNAWMDEGINSFYETRTLLATNDSMGSLSFGAGNLDLTSMLGVKEMSYQYVSEELLYLFSARGNKDQPIQMPSDYFSNMNYGTIVYKKTAIAFNYLKSYLGDDVFDKCMATYYERWKFKHPQPEDLQSVFEEVSGKKLDWFFDTLINTKGHVDYKTTSIKKKGEQYDLTVFNKGDIASPFSVDVIRDGKTISRTWHEGQAPSTWTHVDVNAQKGDIIKLNNVDGIPEYDKNNNTIRTKGLFRNQEPLKFNMLTGIDDPTKSQVFWNPLVGWNNYNKWMLGVQLHNQTIPARNLNWSLAPMYSIATNSVNGFARIENYDGHIGIGLRAQRFGFDTFAINDTKGVFTYRLISPYVRVNLFPNRYKRDLTGELLLEWIMLGGRYKDDNSDAFGEYVSLENDPNLTYGKDGDLHHIRMGARIKKKFLRSELRIQSQIEGGEYTDFGVMQQHTLEYDWIYRGQGKKRIHNRFYLGQSNGFYFGVSGQRTGLPLSSSVNPSDYAYDALFLGRTEGNGILSQQFLRTQGGLAAPTFAAANQLMLSYNVEFDLPVKLPIGIYGGIAYARNKKGVSEETYWNAGVTIPIARNIAQIYIPLIYSSQIKDEVKANDLKFFETILFEFNVKLMNPLQIARNLEL